MSDDTKRYMLRHFIAALAYRGANLLGSAPAIVADFRPHVSVPRDVPLKFPLDREKLRQRFDGILSRNDKLLSEDGSKELMATYGIPVALPRSARTADEAASAAREIGYPVDRRAHARRTCALCRNVNPALRLTRIAN